MTDSTEPTPANEPFPLGVRPIEAAEELRAGGTVTVGRVQLTGMVDAEGVQLLRVALAGRSSVYTLDRLEVQLEALSAA